MEQPCSIEGCTSPARSRGWCLAHYKRWYRHGSPTDLRRLKHRPDNVSIEDWFWSRVTKTNGCWTWTAATNDHGYGQLWDGQRLVYAHRMSYSLEHGEILPDLVDACVLRTCKQ